jgi:hypothetical protein
VNLAQFSGYLYFCGSLLIFLLVQRWLHRELQALFLLLTRDATITIGLFSLLFFPGVFVHELSHFLMAKILGVKTGRFSLIPKVQANGTLRLGYVEAAQVDFFREALIGTAPLISGVGLITWIGLAHLGLLPLTDDLIRGNWPAFQVGLGGLLTLPDFWVWFYLCLSISSTMLPSASDRRAWLPIALFVFFTALLAFVAGAGPWMMAHLMPYLNQGLHFLALVFGASLIVHFVIAVPVWLLRVLAGRLMGLKVA